MSNGISKDEVTQLRERFPVAAHSIRQGHSNSAKTKCAWFVYLDRMAIIDRLDDIFPGEWEYTMTVPVDHEKHYSSVGSLTIRGITRQFNGAQSIDRDSVNDEKGCGTDTFRRTASMWGIGAYMWTAPQMWTDKPNKGDWDKIKACEAEALKKFANWMNGNAQKRETPAPPKQSKPDNNHQSAPTTSNEPEWSDKRKSDFLFNLTTRFPGVHHMPIMKDIGVKELEDLGTRKQAYSRLMEYCYEHAKPVMVNYVRYVIREDSKSKYLEMTADPIAKNGHGIIRAYGRSEKVRDMLNEIDAGLYTDLGLHKYKDAAETTPWIQLTTPLILDYQIGGDDQYPYYTCTGLALPDAVEIS